MVAQKVMKAKHFDSSERVNGAAAIFQELPPGNDEDDRNPEDYVLLVDPEILDEKRNILTNSDEAEVIDDLSNGEEADLRPILITKNDNDDATTTNIEQEEDPERGSMLLDIQTRQDEVPLLLPMLENQPMERAKARHLLREQLYDPENIGYLPPVTFDSDNLDLEEDWPTIIYRTQSGAGGASNQDYPQLEDEQDLDQDQDRGQAESLEDAPAPAVSSSDFDMYDTDYPVFSRNERMDVKKPGPFFEASPNNFFLDKLAYRYDNGDYDPEAAEEKSEQVNWLQVQISNLKENEVK